MALHTTLQMLNNLVSTPEGREDVSNILAEMHNDERVCARIEEEIRNKIAPYTGNSWVWTSGKGWIGA